MQCFQYHWALVKEKGRLRTAHIGISNMGAADLASISSHDLVDVVGLCDVDSNALAAAKKLYPNAKVYADYRLMLKEMESEIDAVIISTPDHTHAPASIYGEEKIEVLGGKMTMTDRGSRLPLIVKWPNKVKPGTRNDDLIELADFLPTLCEMASAPLPKKSIRGRSFPPQLLGKKGNPKQWVHIEYRENRQIRTKDWIYTNKDKLIKVNEIGEPKNNPEK